MTVWFYEGLKRMALKLKTNNSITLFSLVDAASGWDDQVDPAARSYLSSMIAMSPSLESKLDSYARHRRQHKLGWDSQGKLLLWAQAGFPTHKSFSLLWPAIRSVANSQNVAGRPMREQLNISTKELDRFGRKIVKQFEGMTRKGQSFEEVLAQLQLINKMYAPSIDSIQCVLSVRFGQSTRTVHTYGGVILAEMEIKGGRTDKITNGVLYEYVQLALHISKKLEADESIAFLKTVPTMKISYAELFEKIAAAAVCKSITDWQAEEKTDQVDEFVDSHMADFERIMGDFLDENISANEAWQRMIYTFSTWFEELQA